MFGAPNMWAVKYTGVALSSNEKKTHRARAFFIRFHRSLSSVWSHKHAGILMDVITRMFSSPRHPITFPPLL